ncbi:molybdate-anion transporter-like [Corticium candelabrum]|uniref:molybdate-anion transporter-like n=1 Tax=Corticium candelabrum TaxID=121492 RepID=UPI002E258248|nr:molybdate-anion transporter-like [Corticium candelabrum]XP_062504501.1 molybdate-anion transporter-like [Corticium candelabrum]
MFIIAYVSFIVLLGGCILLHHYMFKRHPQTSINNPAFVTFQRGYLLVYYLAIMADWLQGPYLYKLYSHYGFLEPQIAVLYVCGYASNVLFSTFTPLMTQTFGRKKVIIFFTLVYSVCCITKISRVYGVLIVGRILGGASTALLFAAFEAWYVHEHVDTNEFPQEWLTDTFSKSSLASGIIAVTAGVLTEILTEWWSLGPVAPFIAAIPFLVAAGGIVLSQWAENYGTSKVRFKPMCMEGLKHILSDVKVLLIGLAQSLVESVVCVFVFLWTPVLSPAGPPLGIVFANFMVSTMIGGVVCSLLTIHQWKPPQILLLATSLASIALFAAVVFASHPRVSYLAYLVLELCCGMYFSSMSQARKEILPEPHHTAVLNWFRVPLNLTAALVILLLHDTSSGAPEIFSVCTVLMGTAAVVIGHFVWKYKQTEAESSDKVDSADI